MTDLYRHLLDRLAQRFGGAIDESNADAIAYAAAELYHRDFEPRLWEERSAHDLLDLFGVPRAGVFAPLSLSERLVVLQKRSGQTHYVARAHDLLDELGVPRQEHGDDQPLKWRLDQIVASARSNPETTTASENDHGLVDNTLPEDGATVEETRTEAEAREVPEPSEEPGATTGTPAAADDGAPTEGDEGDAGPSKSEPTPTEAVVAVLKSGLDGGEDDRQGEPSTGQVVGAVRALEQAAELEADMAQRPEGAGGIDLVRLTETLNGIQAEIAAVRELVEAFEIGLRRQLDDLQAQITAVMHANGQTGAGVPPPALTAAEQQSAIVSPVTAFDPTGPLPPLPDEALSEEAEPVKERKTLRRILLFLLLLVLGVAVAAGIAVGGAVLWDSLKDQSEGLLLRHR